MDKKREWHAETAFTRMVSVRMPLDLADRLKTYCDQRGGTMTDVVCYAVRDYLDERENDGKEDGGYFLY